jgi:hypothetical protein
MLPSVIGAMIGRIYGVLIRQRQSSSANPQHPN